MMKTLTITYDQKVTEYERVEITVQVPDTFNALDDKVALYDIINSECLESAEDDRYTVGDRVYDDDIFIMGSTVNEENQYES